MRKNIFKTLICGALTFALGFGMCFACACSDGKDNGESSAPPAITKPPVKEKDDKNTKYLEFKRNFKIMVLADIQVETKTECTREFVKITKCVNEQKPDLIVLTGDNVFRPANTNVLAELITCMDALDTPWAPVFGNHDAEGNLTKAQMGEMFTSANNCLFLPGEEFIHEGGDDCLGNYCVNLRSNGKTVYSLFLMDSNMDAPAPEKGYCYLYPDQIEWFSGRAAELQTGREKDPVNIFAFFHIPVPEYAVAVSKFKQDPSNGWGTFKEDVCCSVKNTGFFEAAKQVNTRAIFCGHDHNNTGALDYEGVQLAYALKSSEASYHDEELLGAMLVTLEDKYSFNIENVYFDK